MRAKIETGTKIQGMDFYKETYQAKQLKPLPKLRLTITDVCQLKCVFCGGDEYSMENFQPCWMKNKLDLASLEKFIAKYIEHGGVQVQFTGGEPLVYKHITDIVSIVVNCGGIPEINTNGVALSKRKAAALNKAGLETIKVSIPTFDKKKFALITRVDALDKVFRNMKTARDYLNVRVTMVPLQESLSTFFRDVEFCREELGIKQITLLELLYYPHISDDSKRFFANQHVDLLAEVVPKLEEMLNAKFKEYRYISALENSLYYIESPDDGFKMFIKQANSTLRSDECYKCDHFCQEGLYEMRLSTGGWLSMCNIPNEHGLDISKPENFEKIDEHFAKFKDMFSRTRVSSFKEFAEHHRLYDYIDDEYVLV